MANITITDKVKKLKDSLKAIGISLITIADTFDTNKETRETLKNQIANITGNFLFVIIGEVNAGKSSFVNALLDSSICKTSHEICTQEVQKIIYGTSESIKVDQNRKIVEREFPSDILKDITIVDTPGTNSRELDHQIITEKFIPLCNLVVFVFQMDNIHVQSAWDLFRKIKDKWSKKVVFVLTKSDRYSEEEIENYKSVAIRYASNEGIVAPQVFVTSAQLENNGDKEKSGFESLRHFINTDVLEASALDKVRDDVVTLNTIVSDIDAEFKQRESKFAQDNATRKKIINIIAQKETLATSNVENLTTKCTKVFDKNTSKLIEELNENIGFVQLTIKSFKSVMGGPSTKEWLETINKTYLEDLNEDINQILEGGLDNVKADISHMVIGVKDELDNLKETTISPTDMFRDLEEKRNEMVISLRRNLTDFIDKSPLFSGQQIANQKGINYTGVNVAGGIAAIGTAMAVISQASIIDITGGIATGFFLLLAGGLAVFKKGKYIKNVKKSLAEKRDQLNDRLKENILGYFIQIKNQISHQFSDFDQHLVMEEKQIEDYAVTSKEIKNQLKEVERDLY